MHSYLHTQSLTHHGNYICRSVEKHIQLTKHLDHPSLHRCVAHREEVSVAADQIQALAYFTLTDMFWVAVCSTAVSPWTKGYHEGPGVCQVWVLDVREQEGGRERRGERKRENKEGEGGRGEEGRGRRGEGRMERKERGGRERGGRRGRGRGGALTNCSWNSCSVLLAPTKVSRTVSVLFA